MERPSGIITLESAVLSPEKETPDGRFFRKLVINGYLYHFLDRGL